MVVGRDDADRALLLAPAGRCGHLGSHRPTIGSEGAATATASVVTASRCARGAHGPADGTVATRPASLA